MVRSSEPRRLSPLNLPAGAAILLTSFRYHPWKKAFVLDNGVRPPYEHRRAVCKATRFTERIMVLYHCKTAGAFPQNSAPSNGPSPATHCRSFSGVSQASHALCIRSWPRSRPLDTVLWFVMSGKHIIGPCRLSQV